MRRVGLALVILILVASIPAMAEKGDKIIRFGTAYISPTGDLSYTESDPPYLYSEKIEPDSSLGAFFGFEYMVTDLVGIDGTLMYAKHDVDDDYAEYMDGELVYSESMTLGDITQMPLLISAHFHVVQKDAFDFYVGPTLAYVMYGDLKFVPEAEEMDLPMKDDFNFGLVVGLDAPIGEGGWNFSSAIRYVKTGAQIDQAGVEGPDTMDVDPWMIQVGAAKRW